MGQQVTTSVVTLHELLKKPLNIPLYQRPYTWTSKNVGQLLDDVKRFSQFEEYRIGTVILHRNGEKLDIVDGQQRILTSLLIAQQLELTFDEPLNIADFSIPTHEKTIENVKRNFKFIQQYLDRHEKVKEVFSEKFLSQCIETPHLNHLDEAFQLFDSSNNRGRALDPTDLLKAYHLREMGEDEAKKFEMDELWQQIHPKHVQKLFSAYLYRIKQWSTNKSVSDAGFTNKDLDLFKGINEQHYDEENRWAQSILMAKKYIDTFNQMVKYSDVVPLQYTFQIDQPMINGEYFFKFVKYYYEKTQQLGFWEEEIQSELKRSEIGELVNKWAQYSYFKYVASLYETSLLYVVDRFSEKELGAIEKVCFQYAFYPRFDFQQVQKKTINKYVLDSRTGVENFFHYVNEAFTIQDVLRFSIGVSVRDLRNGDKVKEKAEDLYSLYVEGGNS